MTPQARAAERPFATRRPRLWLRLLGVPVAAMVTMSMIDVRGVAMGVVTGLVYGLLAIGMLMWEPMVSWSRRHPFLDTLMIIPVQFLAVAYFTRLSLITCAAITLVTALLLVPLVYLRRRKT